MRHTREEVIQRTIQEFDLLDQLVANLSEADWQRPVPRPETKDPWTVKDALAHVTHWKADVIRSIRGERRPPEERGLNWTDGNRLIYLRWRDRSPRKSLPGTARYTRTCSPPCAPPPRTGSPAKNAAAIGPTTSPVTSPTTG